MLLKINHIDKLSCKLAGKWIWKIPEKTSFFQKLRLRHFVITPKPALNNKHRLCVMECWDKQI